ncbi:MAG: glycosyltransferase, partial [Candidatus Omnitrophota bacterium]
MARQKFSAVVLTKNVEDQVRGVLESVKWADEIVIVDGFSTDKTVDICKEYGAKIVQHKFEGDFGEERNIGIDNASGDWIL